jgi:hypothetical protein
VWFAFLVHLGNLVTEWGGPQVVEAPAHPGGKLSVKVGNIVLKVESSGVLPAAQPRGNAGKAKVAPGPKQLLRDAVPDPGSALGHFSTIPFSFPFQSSGLWRYVRMIPFYSSTILIFVNISKFVVIVYCIFYVVVVC